MGKLDQPDGNCSECIYGKIRKGDKSGFLYCDCLLYKMTNPICMLKGIMTNINVVAHGTLAQQEEMDEADSWKHKGEDDDVT